MPYLILVTIVWAFSFSLIGQYLAGKVDSDFASRTQMHYNNRGVRRWRIFWMDSTQNRGKR